MSNLYIHLLQTEKTSFCINTHGPNHSPQLFSAHYDPIQHTITIDPPPEYMQNIHQHHTKAHSFAELHDIIQRYTSNPYTIEISCRPNAHRFQDPFIAIVFHSKSPNIIQLQYQRPNHRAGTMLIPIAPWNMNNRQPAHTPFADIIAPIMKRFHAYYIFEYTIPHTNFHTHQLSYTHGIIPQHRIALKVRCLPSTPHSPPHYLTGIFHPRNMRSLRPHEKRRRRIRYTPATPDAARHRQNTSIPTRNQYQYTRNYRHMPSIKHDPSSSSCKYI